jgi:putative flippase GtrA
MEKTRTLEEGAARPLPVVEVSEASKKTPLLRSWFRSHVVSVTATAVDFLVTIFLTEVAALWYVFSNAIGATAGGAVSFTLCRLWVFNRRTAQWHHQAFRYVLAIGLSLTLNTLGVWLLTETLHIPYIVSKIIAAAVVGVSVNFLVFRYFVFK